MAGAGLRVEDSKGECNLGQHEINFPYGPRAADRATSTRSTRTAPRRSPPRRAWRSRSWPSSTSARATRATSTSRCADDDGVGAVRRRPTRCSTRSSPASSPRLRELTLLLRAERQLLQALRRRARSRRPRSPGASDNRTCALRVVGHGAGRALRVPAAGRRRQPLPRAGGADRRRPARRRRASSSSSRPFEGNAYDVRTSRSVPRTLREARDAVRGQRDRARGVRRGGRRPLPQHRADVELAAFEAAVTDWERVRGFERL